MKLIKRGLSFSKMEDVIPDESNDSLLTTGQKHSSSFTEDVRSTPVFSPILNKSSEIDFVSENEKSGGKTSNIDLKIRNRYTICLKFW